MYLGEAPFPTNSVRWRSRCMFVLLDLPLDGSRLWINSKNAFMFIAFHNKRSRLFIIGKGDGLYSGGTGLRNGAPAGCASFPARLVKVEGSRNGKTRILPDD